MASTEVELDILIDIRDAVRDLNSLEKEAKESSDGISASFGAIKAAAAAALAFVAGREVIGFFQDGIEAANKQQTAMSQLEQQLRLTGEASDAALSQFEAFANEMEKTSKFGDDVILNQIAIAKSFGVTNDEAQKLVKAAVELSSATGESLDGAVQQLGKTFSGVAGKTPALKGALAGLSEEALKAGKGVDAVLKRFEGSAAASIDNFAGAVLQANNAFDNFRESFGKVIIENRAVVQAIKVLREGFEKLEEFVNANGEAISNFVTGAVHAMATAIPVAVGVTGDLIKGFQTLYEVGGGVFTALIDIVSGFGRIWQATVGVVYDTLLGLVGDLVKLSGSIPGLGDALRLMGIDTDGAATAIDGFRQGFKDTVDESLSAVEGFRQDVKDGLDETQKGFDEFNKGFDSVAGAIEDAALDVVGANGQIENSADKASQGLGKLARGAKQSAKEISALKKDLESLENQLVQGRQDEAAKAEAILEKQLEEIERLEKNKVISAQRAEELRVLAASNAADKIIDVNKKEADASIAEAKRKADESRAALQNAASEPIKFAISLAEITPADLDPITSQLTAASVGILGKVLEGAAGAKSLIASGAGAFADAFLPGIGPAVSSVVSKLAEGPEATKKFIREFIDAVPEIMVAVGEAMPAVVEALVDSLVNKGGAVRIGIAIAKAMAGEGFLKSIGKQLGLEMGSAFNSSNIAQTLADGFQRGIAGALETFPAKIGAGMAAGLDAIQAVLVNLPGNIAAGFAAGVPAVTAAISLGFEQGSAAIKQSFTDAFSEGGVIVTALTGFVADLAAALGFKPEWLTDFKGAVDALTTTPEWLQRFIDAINSLTSFELPQLPSPGGSTPGPITGVPGSPIATGGVIPQGFPNDTFAARLTSAERVLSVKENSDLTAGLQALAQVTGGGSGDMSAVVALLAQIAAKLDQPTQASAKVEFDGTAFADIMLNLDRRNQRIRA